MKLRYSTVAVLASCLLMAGCGKQAVAPAAPVAATPPGETRHPLTGEIVKVLPERSTLLVSHDKIPDFMMAMTMEFKVSKSDLANAKEGQRIRAELVVRGDELSLEKIWPDDTVTRSTIDAATNALAQDTAMRGKEAYREIGENLPNFTLLDRKAAQFPPDVSAARKSCSILSSRAARSPRCARRRRCAWRTCRRRPARPA